VSAGCSASRDGVLVKGARATVPTFVPTTKPDQVLPIVTTAAKTLAGQGICSIWSQVVTFRLSCCFFVRPVLTSRRSQVRVLHCPPSFGLSYQVADFRKIWACTHFSALTPSPIAASLLIGTEKDLPPLGSDGIVDLRIHDSKIESCFIL